ncbi:c-type cytochrome [Geomonas nitrogeniifigens]|uniref:C-type cytochrome n=1 Tax=Geomonas diazotrophica TaxID=2843197 RepID=A0ABX8JDB4_9BACT|nr:c-type cytochrome [Geomonas nitrogeniifigens]QWV96303.1 c-type cytochrome [Geomonas nitrogeniifigens]
MTGKTARLIFWVGTLTSAAIFLWQTYDFHMQTPKFTHTDKLTEQVVAGKKVWHKYNCNDCHTILGFGGYYAPDMTKAFYRLGENNIASIVQHPEVMYKNSFRKMPHLGVSETETRQLVTFLRWVGEIENRHWPPQDEKFVEAYKLRESQPQKLDKVHLVLQACGGCHTFEHQGRNVGGDLTDIANRITYDRQTLINYMINPQSVRPGVTMPPQDVSPQTAGIIADFVLSLKSNKEVSK